MTAHLRTFLFALLLVALVACGRETATTPQLIPTQASTIAASPTSSAPTQSAAIFQAATPSPTDTSPAPDATATATSLPAPTATAATLGTDQLLDGVWSEGASMPTARSEMPAVALGSASGALIYVPGGFGGERALEAYDPAADAWRTLAPMPEGRHHLMAAAHAGKLYVFGGARGAAWEPTATTWVYDPAADAWSELAPMPEARTAGAAVALDAYLYVVGGAGGSQALLRYDPAADAWTTLASLRQPREHTAAVALDGADAMDGKIYALAGRWSDAGERRSVEVYDPATDTWSDGPSMNVARGGLAAAVLHGHIVVAGGEVIIAGRDTLDSVELFDPATGQWTPAPPLPVALHGVPAAAVDGALYVLGGSDRAAAAENRGRTLIYRP